MHLVDLCTNSGNTRGNEEDVNLQYWAQFRDKFSREKIDNMPSWLNEFKKVSSEFEITQ